MCLSRVLAALLAMQPMLGFSLLYRCCFPFRRRYTAYSVNMIALDAGDHPRRGPEGRVVGVVARPEGPSRRADRGGRHDVREVVDVPDVDTGGGDASVHVKLDRL